MFNPNPIIKTKLNKVELLAPVGNMEMLYAAVQAGCDAVYLAYIDFSARKSANNFTIEELKDATIYCHTHLVKVYVTINTIIYQDEFKKLKEFLDELIKINVDALIVQDLGVIKYIKTHYQVFHIHASTQMNIRTTEGYDLLNKMGVERIVLGRELELNDVKTLCEYGNNIGVETEIFIHGALCFSCSGNCYFSESVGGRSGNRGECAQICRKNFLLYESPKNNIGDDILLNDESKHQNILSMKDLYTLDHIGEIIESGVHSLKIEGRLKSPEYVFMTVSLYRKGIDAYYNHEKYKPSFNDLDNLKVTFNRTFTGGYLLNAPNNSLVTLDFVNHQGIKIGEVVKRNKQEVYIKLKTSVSVQDGLRIISNNGDLGIKLQTIDMVKLPELKHQEVLRINIKNNVNVHDIVVKTYDDKLNHDVLNYSHNDNVKSNLDVYLKLTYPLPYFMHVDSLIDNYSFDLKGDTNLTIGKYPGDERIKEQLSKLGNTPYSIHKLRVSADQMSYVPISLINDLRRQAINKINEYRITQRNLSTKCYEINNIDNYRTDYQTKDQFVFIVSKENMKKLINSYGFNKVYMNNDIAARFETVNNNSVEEFINSIEQINDNTLILNQYQNITNNHSLEVLSDLGVKNVILSTELKFDQIKAMNLNTCNINTGLQVFGRYNVMSSFHCIVGSNKGFSNKGCMSCIKNNYYIVDDHDKKYPLELERTNGCIMNILSAKHINYLHDLDNLRKIGINFFVLKFTDEELDDIENIIRQL